MSEWCLPYEDGSNWLLDETDDEKEQSEDEEEIESVQSKQWPIPFQNRKAQSIVSAEQLPVLA